MDKTNMRCGLKDGVLVILSSHERVVKRHKEKCQLEKGKRIRALPHTTTNWLPAKSWQHFIAGGYAQFNYQPSSSSLTCLFFLSRRLGGMCGAIVTSPFDVVKTRLRSDLFRQKHTSVGAVVGDSIVLVRRPGAFLWHFVETSHIIRLRPSPLSFCSVHSVLTT
jgi:hypothetical protein